MSRGERDCSEGCDGDHKHKWEITPNPYHSSDFDIYVTDSDQEAYDAIQAAGEYLMDDMEEGETKTITIKYNGEQP
jgi:hypothetical protein